MRIPKKKSEVLECTTNNVAFLRILFVQEKKRADDFAERVRLFNNVTSIMSLLFVYYHMQGTDERRIPATP